MATTSFWNWYVNRLPKRQEINVPIYSDHGQSVRPVFVQTIGVNYVSLASLLVRSWSLIK